MASITKNFNVSDGDLATVDTDFETMGLSDQPRVASNQAAPHSVATVGGARIKTTIVDFSDDYQEARTELVTHEDFEGVLAGVMGDTSGNGYFASIRGTSAVRIRKLAAGTPSNLTGDLTPASAFVATDTLSLRYQKDTPSAGTCRLTVYRNGVSFGTVDDSSQLTAGQPWAASINANGTTSPARWDNFYAEDNVGGGTINTEVLDDSVAVADGFGLFNIVRGFVGTDNLAIVDSPTMFLRLTRQLESFVTITEGPTIQWTVSNMLATDEITIIDELVRWARYNRLLQDDIVITDDVITSIIGYLIFTSILTSNVTVTDEALPLRLFNRLLDSNVLTTDQALAALSYTRDLLDGIDVVDDLGTSVQRFILLTDAFSVDDSFASLVVPYTLVDPLIRIGFDQPRIDLGGYVLS